MFSSSYRRSPQSRVILPSLRSKAESQHPSNTSLPWFQDTQFSLIEVSDTQFSLPEVSEMSADEAQKQQATGTECQVPHQQKAEVEGSTPSGYGEVPEHDRQKWGTRIMGPPSAPSAHPQNQQAALWTAPERQPCAYFVEASPEQHSKSPMEAVLETFNKWTQKAETLASNVWMNLKTGQSVPDVAWGKLSLGAKALTEGGFEALFKQTFPMDPAEKLKKTYACYLSTSTGPVAGTLYISTVKIAFCSDRPLSFTAPSGQEAWSYYKVAIPLAKVKAVNASCRKDNPEEKYIQIVTVDNHEFWLMGFVSYDKALSNLQETICHLGQQQNP